MGVAVNAPQKYPQLNELLPSEAEPNAVQDWQIIKANMEKYAAAKNAARKAASDDR